MNCLPISVKLLIFKKGSKQAPFSNRPVYVTVVQCKVMEHVVYWSIIQYLELLAQVSDMLSGPSEGGIFLSFINERKCDFLFIATLVTKHILSSIL